MLKKSLENGKKNMEYKVRISETCLEEFEVIFEYIEKKLKATEASNKLRQKIRNAIRSLRTYPHIYAKIKKKDRTKREYRRIVIDNYVILYTIIEEDKLILISHLYYGRRNYLEGLL